jgi:hypothetical protein
MSLCEPLLSLFTMIVLTEAGTSMSATLRSRVALTTTGSRTSPAAALASAVNAGCMARQQPVAISNGVVRFMMECSAAVDD